MESTQVHGVRPVRRKKKSKSRARKMLFLKIASVCILVTILAATSLGFRFYNEYREMQNIVDVNTIYNGIYINGISLGGLTRSEAQAILERDILQASRNNSISLIHGEEVFEYNFSDFGVDSDIRAAVDLAFSYAREGSTRERYEQIQSLLERPYEIQLELNFADLDRIQQVIAPLQEQLYTDPVNATMTRSNNSFDVIEGTYGSRMNLISTAQEIYNLINLNESGEVNIAFDAIAPEFSGYIFRQSQDLLGTFTTNFSPGNNGRNANIRNAASKINGYIVFPEELFSTNDAFGAMTYANGYRYATVILNGQFVDGIGGGICQVSTNLYMALLYSELRIVQRQNHSRRVGYVPPAFDATLATGLIDLQFINTSENPIFIETIVTNNAVTVNIYGKETRPAGRSITFENYFVENVAPPEETIRLDPTLPEGTRIVETAAQSGVRYRLYKVIRQNGTIVGRERMNTSTYRAFPAVVRVGTGEGVAPEPAPDPVPAPTPTPAPAPEPEAPIVVPEVQLGDSGQDSSDPAEVAQVNLLPVIED